MENFTYEELRMILIAVETEIIRREENPFVNPKRLFKFEDLYEKISNMIQDMKNNK